MPSERDASRVGDVVCSEAMSSVRRRDETEAADRACTFASSVGSANAGGLGC